MITPNEILDFYNAYRNVKGYRSVNSIDSFNKLNDKAFYFRLYQTLSDSGLNRSRRKEFLRYVKTHHDDKYTVESMVNYYDELKTEFKNKTDETVFDYKNRLYKSFSHIDGHLFRTDQTLLDYIQDGKPSTLMKHYKEGKVDEAVLLYIYDISTIKKERWFQIYASDLIKKISIVRERLKFRPELKEYIHTEACKLFKVDDFESPLYKKRNNKKNKN